MRKINILIVCSCIVMSLFLCSCSSDNNAGNLTERDKIELAKKDSAKNAEKSDVVGEEFQISSGINVVGDTIEGVIAANGKLIPNALSYTVTKTSIFSDITEAGINEEELNLEDADILDENGQLKPSVKFIVAEITVKNFKASSEMNITDIDLVYCNSQSMSNEADISILSLPVYFTGQKNKIEKDYYEYNLAIGQSKKVKVGWYLDTEKYKVSNVYLAFNLYLDEYRSFVNLGL